MAPGKSVLIASDHAGFLLKSELIRTLPKWNWIDLGPSDSSRVDYPDFAESLAQKISLRQADQGILICGSGIGMCIAANKFPGVRAALVENPVGARLSKEHNNANVLCLGSRFIAPEYGAEIIEVWLNTPFSQDSRHLERLRKLELLERSTGR